MSHELPEALLLRSDLFSLCPITPWDAHHAVRPKYAQSAPRLNRQWCNDALIQKYSTESPNNLSKLWCTQCFLPKASWPLVDYSNLISLFCWSPELKSHRRQSLPGTRLCRVSRILDFAGTWNVGNFKGRLAARDKGYTTASISFHSNRRFIAINYH